MSSVVYDCSCCGCKTVSPYRDAGEPTCAECWEYKLRQENRTLVAQYVSLERMKRTSREYKRRWVQVIDKETS